MNKIEEFYKEAGGVEYDKFDKKADKFTYYDMIGFADAYHSKQLIIADVSKPKADCFGKSDLQFVYENVDTSYQTFEDWYADYILPI